MTESTARYSFLDRLLHKSAFVGIEIQKSLADIEDRMHAARLTPIDVRQPVFITSLPRAGTTLLLDLVAAHRGFVTHTYRCMPFVLCPILWDSVSRGFRRPSEARERAHGDGMLVGYDSPEAFEEVMWKAFWPAKYRADGIALWSEQDRNPEFEQFFTSHIRKLMLLGAQPGGETARYVSNNNANIGRIGLLSRIFPDSTIVIPFRNPVNQAASLLRQHQRFIDIHREDPFTRYYMESIGHYEFGGAMRLIDFPPVEGLDAQSDPMSGNFWLAYWIRVYTHLLKEERSNLHFFDFDKLCAEPLSSLEALNGVLHIPEFSAAAMQDRFHPAVRYDPIKLGMDAHMVETALSLHERLSRRGIS